MVHIKVQHNAVVWNVFLFSHSSSGSGNGGIVAAIVVSTLLVVIGAAVVLITLIFYFRHKRRTTKSYSVNSLCSTETDKSRVYININAISKVSTDIASYMLYSYS